MHATPRHVARSLRAFKKAHKLGLLHHVRITPGPCSCEAARLQKDVIYICNAVPRLPLAQCMQHRCECEYAPVGGGPFRWQHNKIAAVEKSSLPSLL